MLEGGAWRARAGKIITYICTLTAVPALIFGIWSYYHPRANEPRAMTYKLEKYIFPDVGVYFGELRNEDNVHAKDVVIHGEFSSKIINLDIDAADTCNKQVTGRTIDVKIPRLSKGNACRFEVFVDKTCQIKSDVVATWGDSGKILMKLQNTNDDVVKGIELATKVSSKKGMYKKARASWVANNTKNLGEAK